MEAPFPHLDGSNRTPLSELTNDTKRQLSRMLNGKKVLRTENGYQRDWRGIAKLAELSELIAENDNNPIDTMLSAWIQHNPETAEVGFLVDYLGIIDRWDVQDDIKEYLIRDTESFHQKQIANVVSVDDENVLQLLKLGLPLPRYDACILYAESNIAHAIDIVENLEMYELKLFAMYRDLSPHVAIDNDKLSKFVTHRCNYLIVVVTEEFLQSDENAFFENLSQSLKIERYTRKIIPIVYNPDLELPNTLSKYNCLYYRDSPFFNFWDKLASSIVESNIPKMYYENEEE